MHIGLFDIYKIGIGPSSSHTFGPMVAAFLFVQTLKEKKLEKKVTQIIAKLHGSLCATGKGHLSDIAIILGLSGYEPHNVPKEKVDFFITTNELDYTVPLDENHSAQLSFEWNEEPLPLHENGLQFLCLKDEEILLQKTYYSIGGGFVVENFDKIALNSAINTPFPFATAKELLTYCNEQPLYEILMKNELCFHTEKELEKYVELLWSYMQIAIRDGMQKKGNLPSPTSLSRRAYSLHRKIYTTKTIPVLMSHMEWVHLFAIAMSEENASGSRVITSPTNGACGIVPAVLMYYERFIEKLNTEKLMKFFIVSSAIGSLFKRNASISGAEVGCQGEVGVASSMAAAGLAYIMNATDAQVFIAAEIAMEHHLGLTCDPLNGQVQVPCIERNAIASITAINAVAMALCRKSLITKVSFDEVVETMRQTGKDMDPKYRETSCGGLAVVGGKEFMQAKKK